MGDETSKKSAIKSETSYIHKRFFEIGKEYKKYPKIVTIKNNNEFMQERDRETREYNDKLIEWEKYENDYKRWHEKNEKKQKMFEKEQEMNLTKNINILTSHELIIWRRKMLRTYEGYEIRLCFRANEENEDKNIRSNEIQIQKNLHDSKNTSKVETTPKGV